MTKYELFGENIYIWLMSKTIQFNMSMKCLFLRPNIYTEILKQDMRCDKLIKQFRIRMGLYFEKNYFLYVNLHRHMQSKIENILAM